MSPWLAPYRFAVEVFRERVAHVRKAHGLSPAVPDPRAYSSETMTHDYWLELRAPGIYLDEVAVDVSWPRSSSASIDGPAEGDVEIVNVLWRGIDITNALSKEALDALTWKIEHP